MKNEQSKIESRMPKGEGGTLNAYMYVRGGRGQKIGHKVNIWTLTKNIINTYDYFIENRQIIRFSEGKTDLIYW